MRHIEFFNKDHFEYNYHRVKPDPLLSHFIDFFWETKFEHLWDLNPEGFSDVLFPNIGYTYILNLGTPFIMQVGGTMFNVKNDSFLPRHRSLECYHKRGNIIFGIKFKISPVIFQKKINFSEYKDSISPLNYLLDKDIACTIKEATDFNSRVALMNKYFVSIVETFADSVKPISIVSEILHECYHKNEFSISIQELANMHNVSTRTLQRYFENVTSLSSKQTLQILRVRKAVAHIANSPGDFDFRIYGYYDYSHFYKHLRSFLQTSVLDNLQTRLMNSRM